MKKLEFVGALLALVSLATSGGAQVVADGGFEVGLGVWNIQNTPAGAGAPGNTAIYDVDGPGPLSPSPALQLNAGKVLGATSGGVDLVQPIALVAGQEYAARFHWTIENTGRGSYTSTTKFRLFVTGVSLQTSWREAALIAGLVSAGLDNTIAVPAVFLYRLFTFWVPILPGWLSFQWLERNEYL